MHAGTFQFDVVVDKIIIPHFFRVYDVGFMAPDKVRRQFAKQFCHGELTRSNFVFTCKIMEITSFRMHIKEAVQTKGMVDSFGIAYIELLDMRIKQVV